VTFEVRTRQFVAAIVTGLTLVTSVAYGNSFFGVSDTSVEGQKLELEFWLTENLGIAFSKFLPPEAFHIQTKIDLFQSAPRIVALNLGKLNAFSPVMTEMPRAHRAFLARVQNVKFTIAIDDNVPAETREALQALAKQSVPLVERQHVKVDFVEIRPISISFAQIWRETKWPLTGIIMVFLLSFALVKVSGLEWPHFKDLGREWLAAFREAMKSHRVLVQVDPKFRAPAYELEKERLARQGESGEGASEPQGPNPYIGYIEDPHHEVRKYLGRLGVSELLHLVKSNVEFGVQILSLLAKNKSLKVQSLLGADIRSQIVARLVDSPKVTIVVEDVVRALSHQRADEVLRSDASGAASWISVMSVSEERAFYARLVQQGHLDKAIDLAMHHLPIEMCRALPPEILAPAFSDLPLESKLNLIVPMKPKDFNPFYEKAVIANSKLDLLLRDEMKDRKPGSVSSIDFEEAQRKFALSCRAALANHSGSLGEVRILVADWVKAASGGSAYAKTA
jgi:hypothetical protein